MYNVCEQESTLDVLTFFIGNAQCAIPISYIQGVISAKTLLNIPSRYTGKTKIINIDGNNIPVIDLERLLFKRSTPVIKELILILGLRSKRVGFLIGRISKLLKLEHYHLKYYPKSLGGIYDYLYGIYNYGGQDIMVLNPGQLFNCDQDLIMSILQEKKLVQERRLAIV